MCHLKAARMRQLSIAMANLANPEHATHGRTMLPWSDGPAYPAGPTSTQLTSRLHSGETIITNTIINKFNQSINFYIRVPGQARPIG